MTDTMVLVPLGEPLNDFEGLDEQQAGAEIPGAAGGLRKAMKVDGRKYRQGQRIAVVLDCVVLKVRHEPIDDDEPDGPQRRVHILATEGATIVSRDLVAAALDAQAERIKAAEEEEARQKRLADGKPQLTDGFELAQAHSEGKHAEGYVEGCEVCDKARLDAEADANAIDRTPDWGPGSDGAPE